MPQRIGILTSGEGGPCCPKCRLKSRSRCRRRSRPIGSLFPRPRRTRRGGRGDGATGASLRPISSEAPSLAPSLGPPSPRPVGTEICDEEAAAVADALDELNTFTGRAVAALFDEEYHYGVILHRVTELVVEDRGGATQWRVRDGQESDMLRFELRPLHPPPTNNRKRS